MNCAKTVLSFVGVAIGMAVACPSFAATLGESRKRCLSSELAGNEAVSACTFAIRQKPKDARLFVQRGVAWSKNGDIDFAIGDYSKAIKLDAQMAPAYYHRGVAREGKGAFEESLIDFKKYAELKPDDPEAQLAVVRVTAEIAAKATPQQASTDAKVERVSESSVISVLAQVSPAKAEESASQPPSAPKDDFFLYIPILFLLGSIAAVTIVGRRSKAAPASAPEAPAPSAPVADQVEEIIVEIRSATESAPSPSRVEDEPNPPLAWVWSEYRGELR